MPSINMLDAIGVRTSSAWASSLHVDQPGKLTCHPKHLITTNLSRHTQFLRMVLFQRLPGCYRQVELLNWLLIPLRCN